VAVTSATLKANHPEFDDLADALVTAQIANATTQISNAIFPTTAIYDEAITWYTCYLLSTSPYTRDKRRNGTLDVPEGYLNQFERIARAQGTAYRWISGQTE